MRGLEAAQDGQADKYPMPIDLVRQIHADGDPLPRFLLPPSHPEHIPPHIVAHELVQRVCELQQMNARQMRVMRTQSQELSAVGQFVDSVKTELMGSSSNSNNSNSNSSSLVSRLAGQVQLLYKRERRLQNEGLSRARSIGVQVGSALMTTPAGRARLRSLSSGSSAPTPTHPPSDTVVTPPAAASPLQEVVVTFPPMAAGCGEGGVCGAPMEPLPVSPSTGPEPMSSHPGLHDFLLPSKMLSQEQQTSANNFRVLYRSWRTGNAAGAAGELEALLSGSEEK